MDAPRITVAVETFPVAGTFTIARGSRTEAIVVAATLERDGRSGRGECVPYARYGESVAGVAAAIRAAAGVRSRAELQAAMPAGAARNALDCAFWELEAREAGTSVREIAGIPPLRPVQTCYTLSLAAPDEMAARAAARSEMGLLKLKLGGSGDAERLRAVRRARPDARLVADANEAWTAADLVPLLAVAAECGVELVEQPLPAGADALLASVARPVPVCADESAHTTDGLAALRDRYDAVNIKLDKTGGLTGALAMADAARSSGLKVMVGCMLSTSLAMAPALLLSHAADWLDLDGPLLLARDREPGIVYRDGIIAPPAPGLWG